jgi:hypothetical protein
MDSSSSPLRSVPIHPKTLAMIEELLVRLRLDKGRWKLSIESREGKVENVDRHEFRIQAEGLERFDEPPARDEG